MPVAPASSAPVPVLILMGVYNGARHLAEQLESLAAQDHVNWRLLCSDDGSSDGSQQVIRSFAGQNRHPLELRQGPGQGFSRNFMQMIRNLEESPEYISFSDQDDIWLPHKLSRALTALSKVPATVPALYASRQWVWESDTQRKRLSARLQRPAGFRNALVENIATGNTIVLNPAAAGLVREAARLTGDVFAHDWWLYLLISGVGGRILFDEEPGLLYRQHGANVIGEGAGIRAQLRRKYAVMQGAFAQRVGGNLQAMQAVAPLLTPDTRSTLERFTAARQSHLPCRLWHFYQSGVYRQSRASRFGFWGGAALGRV